jgi:hypothetical protein
LLGSESAERALPDRLRIARAQDGDYALVLEQRGESRTLRDPDCRTLFKTAVVVAAAAVDPALLEQVPAARGADAPTRAAPPKPKNRTPSPPATADEPRAHVPWRAGAAVGVGAALALLPRASPLLELSGTLARGAFGVALCARYLTSADERLDDGDEYGVSVHGFGARLAALYDPAEFARLQAGVALDRYSGRGLGSAIDEVSGSGVALALVLEAAVIPLRVGHARLSLAISGQYALVRPSFEITGRGEVYRPPPFGATGIVRLGWEFD